MSNETSERYADQDGIRQVAEKLHHYYGDRITCRRCRRPADTLRAYSKDEGGKLVGDKKRRRWRCRDATRQKTETQRGCPALSCHGYIQRALQTAGEARVEKIRRLVYQERSKDRLGCGKILNPFRLDSKQPEPDDEAPLAVPERGQKRKISPVKPAAPVKRLRPGVLQATTPADFEGPVVRPGAPAGGEGVDRRQQPKISGDQTSDRLPAQTGRLSEAARRPAAARGRTFQPRLLEAYRLTAQLQRALHDCLGGEQGVDERTVPNSTGSTGAPSPTPPTKALAAPLSTGPIQEASRRSAESPASVRTHTSNNSLSHIIDARPSPDFLACSPTPHVDLRWESPRVRSVPGSPSIGSPSPTPPQPKSTGRIWKPFARLNTETVEG